MSKKRKRESELQYFRKKQLFPCIGHADELSLNIKNITTKRKIISPLSIENTPPKFGTNNTFFQNGNLTFWEQDEPKFTRKRKLCDNISTLQKNFPMIKKMKINNIAFENLNHGKKREKGRDFF